MVVPQRLSQPMVSDLIAIGNPPLLSRCSRDSQGGFSPASHRACDFHRTRRTINADYLLRVCEVTSLFLKPLIVFRFWDCRIVVPYAPPPFGLGVSGFSQVCLRLPRLPVHIQSALTMPLRSTPITGASSLLRAPAPWMSRSFPTCAGGSVIPFTFPCTRPRFLCSLCFSFAYRF